MLVKTGLNDSQVMYWEPAKYVAKLRRLKSDSNPLLFKINMGAGHGGASGRYDYLREIVLDYAFLLRQIGIHHRRSHSSIMSIATTLRCEATRQTINVCTGRWSLVTGRYGDRRHHTLMQQQSIKSRYPHALLLFASATSTNFSTKTLSSPRANCKSL